MGMIEAKCPNCGAEIQLDDSREFGFCNYCGTKVMQDKIVVEHRGNIKVDNSDYVQKFLQNARRALAKEDWEEVEKYYNLVEQNAPNNMEAVFFSSYGKAMLSLTDKDYFKREQKFKVLNKSMSVISDYYEVTDENKEEVLNKIANYIIKMYSVSFVYQSQSISVAGAINSLAATTGTKQWCINLLNNTKATFVAELREIAQNHDEEYIKELINRLDPPKEDNGGETSEKKSGCYVATAVYGSYDCPQVWTLRRFRDYSLAMSWYGRLFITLYYAVSPTVVKWFGGTKWFNKIWKSKLDRMVEKLQAEGYESTPYNDRKW